MLILLFAAICVVLTVFVAIDMNRRFGWPGLLAAIVGGAALRSALLRPRAGS